MKKFVILSDQDPNRLTIRINEHAAENWIMDGPISTAICGIGLSHEHGTTEDHVVFTVLMSKLMP